MTALEDRLRSLGDRLAVDGSTLVDDVAARLDDAGAPVGWAQRPTRRRALTVAAAIVLFAVGLVVATPSARRAVADWLGFDGVTIERDPGVGAPSASDPFDDAAEQELGTVVELPDRDVLVSQFTGSLDPDIVTKTLGDGSDVVRVDVDGAPGIWIDGDPHEVVFRDGDGEVVVERFAGNTLLWQDGDVIHRLEGFDTLAAALTHATTLADP